jgi:hypothetical protein
MSTSRSRPSPSSHRKSKRERKGRVFFEPPTSQENANGSLNKHGRQLAAALLKAKAKLVADNNLELGDTGVDSDNESNCTSHDAMDDDSVEVNPSRQHDFFIHI